MAARASKPWFLPLLAARLAPAVAALEPASRHTAGKKEPRARGLSSARGGKCCVMPFDHVSPPTGRLRPLALGAMSHTRGHTTGRPLPRPENPVLVRIRSIACLPNRDVRPLARAECQSRGLLPQCQPLPATTPDVDSGCPLGDAAVHEVDACQPELGLANLLHRWQVLGTVPDATSEAVATLPDHAVDECLTQAVLLHLDVKTRQLGQKPVRLGALLQALRE